MIKAYQLSTFVVCCCYCCAVAVSSSSSYDGYVSNFTWPLKRAAELEGNLIIGGLMMVHERQDDITCGPIMPQVSSINYYINIGVCLSLSDFP